NQEWSGDPQTHGLRLPRRRPRRTHPTLLQRALQLVFELPSSLRASRGRSRRERPQTLLLPALSDAAGDAAGPVPTRTVLAPWTHRRRLTTHRRGGQRYRSRPAHAASQTQTLRAVAACRLRKKMKLAAARAVEMTGGAKPCGFRTPFGNRCAIPTFPPPRRLLDCFLNSNPERSFPQPSAQASFRLILRLEKTVVSSQCRAALYRCHPERSTRPPLADACGVEGPTVHRVSHVVENNRRSFAFAPARPAAEAGRNLFAGVPLRMTIWKLATGDWHLLPAWRAAC